MLYYLAVSIVKTLYFLIFFYLILGRDHCRQPERQCKFLQKMQVVKNEMFKGLIWLYTVSTWQLKNITVFVCTYIGTKKCEESIVKYWNSLSSFTLF